MSSIKRKFFGFPFLKNHSEVELVKDVFLGAVCNFCGMVSSEVMSLLCSHRLCVLCFSKINQEYSESLIHCPIDDIPTDFKNLHVLKDIAEVVGQVEAFCWNQSKGCDHVGALSSLQGHYSFCDHHEVQCEVCKSSVLRKNIFRHISSQCDFYIFDKKESTMEKFSLLEHDLQKMIESALQPKLDKLQDEIAQTVSASMLPKFEEVQKGMNTFITDNSLSVVLGEELRPILKVLETLKPDVLFKKTELLRMQNLDQFIRKVEKKIQQTSADTQNVLLNAISLNHPECIYKWKAKLTPEEKENIESGEGLDSGKFFSHANGYYLFLYLEEDETCKSVGIFLDTCEGPYDDKLEWPFRWDYTFKLVHTKNSDKTQTFTIKSEEIFDTIDRPFLANRKKFPNSVGFGWDTGFSLSDLVSEEYIIDDVLTIEVSFDPMIKSVHKISNVQ